MIDRRNWQWFRVGDLFSPQKCKCSNATELLEDGDEIAYIGAKKSDNGIMRYVKRVENLVSRGNCIVFIGDGQGSVGYSLYQPIDFIGSTTLIVGYNEHLNPYNAAFLVSVLDLERFRYSFGRKYKKEVVANTKIQLPAIKLDNGDYTPDWKYMEDFVKDQIIPQLPKKAQRVWLQKYDTTPQKQENMKLNTQDWKWFRYDEIFDIKHGFYNKKPEDNPEGDIPFIGATDSNNGITSYSDLETISITSQTGEGKNAPIEEKLFDANSITVSNDGSVGYAFFQNKQFTCSHSVNPLYLKGHEINPYIALFLCTLIEKERFRWAYGRKWRPIRMPSSKIKLPVTPSGTPDWKFMEDYIKSLPFSRNIEPSKPNEVVDELVEMKKEMIKMRKQLEAQQASQEVKIIGGNVTYIDNSKNYNIQK